jgi:peroxiredoxin
MESVKMIQPGDAAPDFSLPAVHREGTVSLADYRGRSPLLLALFRGFYCPFCRRQMGQLATVAGKLKAQGLEVLGVAAADPDRARLYVTARPLRLPMGADPALTAYRAYGLGQVARTPDAGAMVEAAASRWARQLAIPFTAGDARTALDRSDGFIGVDSDRNDRERHQIQMTGQFLIDAGGIVRWCHIEDRDTYAAFPDERTLLSLTALLPR